MFTFLISRLLTGWFAFLLPSYSTFKALRQRPLDEREIDRWTHYWILIGTIITFEYTAEGLLSWFPFYWETKTFFLLFLSLPQFEGSTYVYKSYLEPFLVQNESDIDAGIASARNETLQFIQSRLSALWDILYSLLSKTPVTPNPSPLVGQKVPQLVQGLWGTTNPSSDRPAMSRSTSATSEKSSARPNGAAVSVGYDADETVNQ
ncbi:TB2/DP1, HVA22 family-domain-containing protein [Multifurca ochricompacta]|uniref:Protein YOP1 n=1 Tax=Multifurca ochricompacta TaxID=376703 RepID=A0AAD4QTN6_9AGAM|nr:TB2/DP1, HVA22 family-domain-containing protein [Multifurca ochricompacta]